MPADLRRYKRHCRGAFRFLAMWKAYLVAVGLHLAHGFFMSLEDILWP